MSATWEEAVTEVPKGGQLVHYGCDQFLDSYVDGVNVYQGVPSAKAVGRIATNRYSELAVKEFHAFEPNYIASFQIGGKAAS
ncbi:MAG TPA: hypothetical protein EYN31_04790 [Candidatus Marinimicrobia bacterium]|nr:hypothetical protein [Candidatus Neomarinimicrobiota bacterium]